MNNWAMMGKGRTPPQMISKNKDKTPFGYPLVPLSMIWRVDCFPVSERTKNKSNYPYGGVDRN